ncbi:MAG: TolC family protein [Planctomycetaceae bacterium]|nr:TolC family protein [Planctomycetaceae bacterium]
MFISKYRILAIIVCLAGSGCHSHQHSMEFGSVESYMPFVQQVEYPDADPNQLGSLDISQTQAPPSIRSPEETEKWPLTLQEATRIALANSEVIRELGGRVVASPATSSTVYDPAIREADPRFGVEAALSAFDAQMAGSLFIEQRDRQVNNTFFASSGVFTNEGEFNLGINKTAATGTRFSMSNVTLYNRNNNFMPGFGNRFASYYDTLFTAEARHPLMQGSGVEYNRIAGPNGTIGLYRGVLLARIDTDVTLADFEANVRNLLTDVEKTYWELYFAYRDLDAKLEGRRLARESWELEKRRADAGIRTADQEAFAREQFYAGQAAVENALSGTANNIGGVYKNERELRRLLGLPTSDGRLIVPVDEPATVDVRFDWHESLGLALTRRVELRRQQWTVKRRELEIIAARNFEKMRVDLVGQYRWRGFGDDLFGSDGTGSGSAFESLFDGKLQDWQLGIEVATPVGNRVGHAAVRHAELQLARERAIYDETERTISHELRAAFTELDRAYAVTRSRYNQRVASFIRLRAERLRNERGQTDLDLVLSAQRQAVESEINYHRALTDYNVALVDVHYARGTLLDYLDVSLAEGAWIDQAHRTAPRVARRFRPRCIDYCMTAPARVSLGEFPQRLPSIDPESVVDEE